MLVAPFAGWLDTLGAVADPVFAGGMMGEGFSIDPVEGVLRAPADAIVSAVAASAHAITLRLANGSEVLLHIGLETVALGGKGFRVRVGEGDAVRAGDPLIAFDLDAVGRAAKDLVTPVVLPGEGIRVRVDRPGRMVAAGEEVAWAQAPLIADPRGLAGERHHRTIRVASAYGLHARPAARIVALLQPFAADVELARGERRADARSPVALLSLGAAAGDLLDASAGGAEAQAALDALERFAAARFGDPEGKTPGAPPTRQPSRGGVCASPGLAIGRTLQLRFGEIAVAEEGAGIAQESAALDTALQVVRVAQDGSGGGAAGIAEAHRAMLDDPVLLAHSREVIAAGRSAGAAWRSALSTAARALEETGDARLIERVADLRDLERQVLVALTGETPAIPTLPPDTILLADDLLPSQFLALDRGALAGICTAAGGPTAHVAILAAAAGVPMVVAAGDWVRGIADDTTAVLDADAAQLILAPDIATLSDAGARIEAARSRRSEALQAAQAPASTADGTRIEVFANLGSVEDTVAAVTAGAEGCGLLRTEFLFLDRDTAPDEAEQRALYGAIATNLGDRPLIVRTLDIGGDKPVPYLPFPHEENPALGQRGIRLSLARADLLDVQLRAIIAAVPGAQCRIMLPMVVDAAELHVVRTRLDAAMAAVGRADPVALGVMIETPAAALLADQLAAAADFLSIGTNDLTQYALAADRGNAAVSSMVDALHPAVLRLIRMAAEGARRHARPIGMCGSLASNPRATALLVGLGLTELSVVPAAVPAVKAAVRGTALPAAQALAARALEAQSASEVRALIDEPGA